MKYDWSKEKLEQAIKNSDSYSETLRYLNIPTAGRNTDTLKNKIKEYNLDISHFTFSKQYLSGTDNVKYKPAKMYLTENSNIKSYSLKNKLFQENIKENKCEKCGITEWMGQPIMCQLHHINGDESDNRIENLQILCPNCHSLTENYAGKSSYRSVNKKTLQMGDTKHYYCPDCGTEITRSAKYCVKCAHKHSRKIEERPSAEQLLQDFKELKSMVAIGKKYQVSDKTISKWLKSYDLPYKSKDLKEYITQ